MDKDLYNNESVCAVVISFNNNGSIRTSVNALIGQVGKIVIVDNGSNKTTVSALNELESEFILVIYNDKNEGIATALNLGVKFAISNNFNWVLTMDQDSIPEVDMVGKLLKCAYKYKDTLNAVSFSPQIILDDSLALDADIFEERYTVITSGNLLYLDVFSKIGYFEEKLFIDSVDFDFCLRLLINNFKIIRCYSSKLYHTIGVPLKSNVMGITFVSLNHSFLRKYYITRNNIYLLQKYALKFPLFCLRKQFGMFAIFLHVVFFEDDKFIKLKFMFKGLLDGFCGKYGEMKEK